MNLPGTLASQTVEEEELAGTATEIDSLGIEGVLETSQAKALVEAPQYFQGPKFADSQVLQTPVNQEVSV